MEKRVQRLESERTFVSAGSGLELQVELSSVRSKEVIRIEGLAVTPGGQPGPTLCEIEQLLIRPGERLALLGANGVGKSSLIRMITAACRGEARVGIRVSEQTQLGYYDQELVEADSEASIAEFLVERAPVGDQVVRARLIGAGFPYRDHGKAVSVLSGGERARVLFVLLSLRRPNFLILDEPTNHIDVKGRVELEEQLLASGATVLVTSHDRYFLGAVSERFLLIRDGRLQEIGDPAEFYESPERIPATAPGAAESQAAVPGDPLTRLVELEALLAADLERKPKFQKPRLQAQWRTEIAALYRRLD
ncbi:MAG: ABC-F family ATP-binding cassette domain-containing protein [Gammaproteobacteria bacterium]|nr:ABC-F family ATP-binding cassette domain-containing protein [Gammaproteobacteria bacterium]